MNAFDHLQKNKNPLIHDDNDQSLHGKEMTNLMIIAGMAHEVRNPLTTVKGFLQLIKPHLIEIGKEQYVNIALNEINRANDLLLEYMNSAKNTATLKEPLSLNNFFKDLAPLYNCEGIMNNIEITIQLPQEDLIILANEIQIKQVLGNIMKNAIEAIICNPTMKDRRIALALSKENSSAVIQVEDSGCGMTAETLNHIFNPFYTTKGAGTGIGLPLCKKIIENHSGILEIKSSPGNGTVINIELPLCNEISGA